ncbi:MAG: DUF4197 domain-containing protein [Hylemonella sp.]|nr:DUF4197 domain-containing protein [Hylemonella sp.]
MGVPLLHPCMARAITLDELTQGEAARALKAALERGARSAIGQLGQLNGFLGNERVRIPLPRQLQDAEPMLRTFGQGGRLDELVTTMNRAAEAAVPMAQELMLGAVRNMSVADAKKILGGGETSVTSFFVDKTRVPLGQKFLPIVTRSTEKVGLAAQYNHIASKAADFGLLPRENASIERYVTGKALDGLYYVVGEEERKIRRDPAATGSALLSKVFGALR